MRVPAGRTAADPVLVCLAQRYLRNDPQPQPQSLTWAQVADELNARGRRGGGRQPWTDEQAAHVVAKARQRLSRQSVAGLVEKEVPPPVGNALNHSLVTDLLVTTSLRKSDLRLLGE